MSERDILAGGRPTRTENARVVKIKFGGPKNGQLFRQKLNGSAHLGLIAKTKARNELSELNGLGLVTLRKIEENW